jgi:kynurenine 3-monooxygenase
MTSSSPQTVAIIGGGPVGALASLYFAKYFSKVTLYELRAGPVFLEFALTDSVDPRIPANRAALPNKSINLALSDRGIIGIRGISEALADEVVGMTIPMRGRCLHDRRGNQVTQFYDVYGRVIHSPR